MGRWCSEQGQVVTTDRGRTCVVRGSIRGSGERQPRNIRGLFTDFHLLLNIPPEGDSHDSNSLRLPDAGIENREFIFPRGGGDSCELLVECCGGERAVGVVGKEALDFLPALLSPLLVDGEVDEHPACLLG